LRACVALILLLSSSPALADGVRLPLSVAVGRVDGAPVATDAWLDEQLARATAAFRSFAICFAVDRRVDLDAAHARLETRADRHALAGLVAPGRVNVFVVGSLRDVDDPSLLRMGVHWRSRGRRPSHYVIVAASAWPTTLAHELGHFFGNPHSRTAGNLMSYEGRSETSGFDAAQGRRIAAHLRRFLHSAEIQPLPGGC
jgi:hypothetical protein